MSRSYYYTRNGKEYGPVSVAELRERFNNNRLSPTDLLWTEGMPEWKPAADIPGLLSPAGAGIAVTNQATSAARTGPVPSKPAPHPPTNDATTPVTKPVAVDTTSSTMDVVRHRCWQVLASARTTAVVTARHLVQCVACGIVQGKIGLARREAVRTRADLGMKMYSTGLGTADQRRMIQDIEVRI